MENRNLNLHVYITEKKKYIAFFHWIFSHVDQSALPFSCKQISSASCCHSVTKLCLTLCDPMDCGPLVSSVHGILQAKILEWIAIAFSRGSFDPGIEPGSPPLQADSYHLSHREEDPLGFPLKKK